ncbi:MAG: long-chain fatty acid--CoA ligase, partial [Chromatiales bacterium]|nr:long-chain fatty acid--CoA ligase [Chromatiales bacterium]
MIALPVDARRIGECVSFHAAREPGREAAVRGRTRLAYRDLDRVVTRWAAALLAAGVARGDRVASLTPPSTEWLAAMLATTEIGAVWTGYHPRYRLPEFRHVTGLAEPSVLIAFRRIHGRDYAGELTALMREHPSVRRVVTLDEPLEGGVTADEFLADGATVPAHHLERARRAVDPGDTAVLIFTSGTTGRPKAAMITHRALLTGAAVENEHWPMDRPRLLHMMPVNHIAGVGMVGVFGLYIGGTLVFQDRFDAGDLLRLLEEERIDHVLGSPVQFHMMAHHPDLGTRDLSRLRFITWGGAPMAARLVARLRSLPGELRTSYGMTELGLYVTYSEPDADLDTLSRTIGKPHPGFEIRVADASGAIAEPGGQGEIQARGDWLLAGY